ncbi:glycosyltransferase family 4 protein [Patescibacteria group bacterium]|nr:glycosyltransferase family 4 protein [Patescibacteria group bacterium]
MKIAFLSRYQNQIQRGAENFVLELSTRLSKNYDVNVFSGKDADDLSKIIKGGYDIVIPINGRLQSLKTSFGRILGKYKLLITGHSGIGRDDIWNIAVCKPDVFVALTEHMAFWAKGWAWGSEVVKIPNGIDLNKFSPDGEKIKLDLPKPIILSVGALVWYKYHDKLIHALSKTDEGSLLIVGKGEMQEELERLGQKLLPNRFKILNFSYEDMQKVYRSCDLFSLPSWDREAFGLVYLEAMATGKGVVAPDDQSRREIVGDAGLFTNVENPDTYAKIIEEALACDWLKKAKVQAEKFSWEKVAIQYENVMIDMLKK